MPACIIVSKLSVEDDFGVHYRGECSSAEEAQEDFSSNGSGEVLVEFIEMDEDDSGVRAFASVLELAIDVAGGTVPLEGLLLEIFMAGRRSVTA
jgi:hypothetical protein